MAKAGDVLQILGDVIFGQKSKSSRKNHLFTWSNDKFNFVPSKEQHSFESVLTGKKNKKMLKHKAELLPTNEKSLFRNEFRVNIITDNLKRDFSKARKQYPFDLCTLFNKNSVRAKAEVNCYE